VRSNNNIYITQCNSMYRHRRMNIKRMMVSNTSYVVLFVLFCVSSFCVLCSTDIVLCFLFVCLRLVSCVWWCSTHIVLGFFCVFVLVSCVHQILCSVLFVFVLCLVYGGVPHILWGFFVFFLSSSCDLCT
jgi:hypothetical protein